MKIKNCGQLTAFILDGLFWSYGFLVTYQIIYQNLIVRQRYTEFDWNVPLYALGMGFVLALVFFRTKMSLGRALKGLIPLGPEEHLLRQSYVWFGIFLVVITFITGIHLSEASFNEFFSPAGMAGAKRIFLALLNPNFAIIEDALLAGR